MKVAPQAALFFAVVRLRHQDGDIFADHLFTAVAEQALRHRVEQFNHAAGGDAHDAFIHIVQHRPFLTLGVAQTGTQFVGLRFRALQPVHQRGNQPAQQQQRDDKQPEQRRSQIAQLLPHGRVQLGTVHFQHHSQPKIPNRRISCRHLLFTIIAGGNESGFALQRIRHRQGYAFG